MSRWITPYLNDGFNTRDALPLIEQGNPDKIEVCCVTVTLDDNG